jgi:hypothetical protein
MPLPRRGFLVSIGATILGRFRIPSLSGSKEEPEAEEDFALAEDPVRRFITIPKLARRNDRTAMIWSELVNGESRTMFWEIETAEELERAEFFHTVMTWKRWKTERELHELVKAPGPWLVRWNHDGLYGFQFHYLRTGDWDWLFGPGSDQRPVFNRDDPDANDTVFVSNPAKAAKLTSAQVLAVIHLLTENYGFDGNTWDYFEPVLPSEPQRDFRAENFKLPHAQVKTS